MSRAWRTVFAARTVAALTLLIFAEGCITGRQEGLVTQRFQDPPQLSPFAQPLNAPDIASTPYGAMRPVPVDPQTSNNQNQYGTSDQYGPLTTIPPRKVSPHRKPNSQPGNANSSVIERQEKGSRQVPEPLSGPSLGDLSAPFPEVSGESREDRNEPSVTRGQPLSVAVNGPEAAYVGDDVTFSVTVRNADRDTLEGVIVLCSLPEGFVFPGAPQRAFRQQVGRLGPAESRTLDLTLQCEQTGRHCVEFRVSADGLEERSELVCVNCFDREVRLELLGPTQRIVDGRAEFVATLVNLTGEEQSDVHVSLAYEGVLEPREASMGAVQKSGQLEWDLGILRVAERVQIQVEFECLAATRETCVTARLSGRELEPRQVRACLEVSPRGPIEIELADDHDSVSVGERVTYTATIRNRSLESISGLLLQFEPNGLQPTGILVNGENRLIAAQFDPATGILRLPLADVLPRDVMTTVALQTMATHAGQRGLRVSLYDRDKKMIGAAAEPTIVNVAPGSIAWGRR